MLGNWTVYRSLFSLLAFMHKKANKIYFKPQAVFCFFVPEHKDLKNHKGVSVPVKTNHESEKSK